MKIIIGLGNPGDEYKITKHNVGWMYLEHFEKEHSLSGYKKKLNSKILEFKLNNEKIVLVRPQTYMNLSGEAIAKIKNYYKVENKDIMVIFDDIDIPFGTIRYKQKGSGGSHNGMKNIIENLHSQDIPRIRIGIGGIKNEHQDLRDFVLSRFSKEQLESLENVYNLVDNKIKEVFLLDK